MPLKVTARPAVESVLLRAASGSPPLASSSRWRERMKSE
jgi:hypothetical protein